MCLGLIIFMQQETDRVNSVADAYIEIIVKNSWFVGCAQGTNGDFQLCHDTMKKMNWTKFAIDIKRVK